MNMLRLRQYLIAAIVITASSSILANDPVVFPANDQSPEQQSKDEYSCYEWAKGQTGFDPMSRPTAETAPPQQQAHKGGVGRGALGGAAIGGIVDGSDGAKTGAAVGAVGGGIRRNNQRRQQSQQQANWEQQENANYNEQRGNYNRNYSACMEGKGYTVK